jgi:hypothetical protein
LAASSKDGTRLPSPWDARLEANALGKPPYVGAADEPHERETAVVTEPAIESLFERAFRGYDTAAVSALVAEVTPALQTSDVQVRHRALEQLRQAQVQLPVVMRGYQRRQVQEYLEWIAAQPTAPPSLQQ